jgi:mono/diheme cytochrome c family protein
MKYLQIIAQTFLLVLFSQTAIAGGDSGNFQVKDGKVDPATFIGYTTYHSVCVSCHGVGGVGTEVAPDLTSEIMDHLSQEQFRLKVMHRTIVRFTTDDWLNMEESMYNEIAKQGSREKGALESMPRWQHNPMVTKNVDNIYRYLKARAAGAIGPDKPGVLK